MCSILFAFVRCITVTEFSHIEIHGFWFNCTENVTSFTGMGDEECIPLVRSKSMRKLFTLLYD